MSTRKIGCFGFWLGAGLVVLTLALGPAATQAASKEPLSTGIGVDERVPHGEYALKLVFAAKSGPYLAAVDVIILDSDGKQVLKTHSTGPWLFVDLPPGTYVVHATPKRGKLLKATVEVTADEQAVLNLVWDQKD